ncbi:MAG: hypothetical protein H6598_00140 [Flavobacteriales bacterium]|nr:hypothetical protein [Flavobacteriales bacterium]
MKTISLLTKSFINSNILIILICVLAFSHSFSQNLTQSNKPVLEEYMWTNFNSTIYIDTNTVFQRKEDKVFATFVIASDELSAKELKLRMDALKIWNVESYSFLEGEKLLVTLSALRSEHIEKKDYLLRRLRCVKTIVNGNQVPVEDIINKITK